MVNVNKMRFCKSFTHYVFKPKKIYVQHIMAEQAAYIWQLISEKSAYFFIAGYVFFICFKYLTRLAT